MILQDVLKPNLDIVFCGTAAGEVSAKRGAYYAGPGNQFYPILYKSGLTPHLIAPENYNQLVNHNIGLTDLVKLTSGNDNILIDSDFDIKGFEEKILKHSPRMVCFNGKKAAATFFNTKTKHIHYGLQPQTIGKTKIYVAPSTSGSARKFWDESYWVDLKKSIL